MPLQGRETGARLSVCSDDHPLSVGFISVAYRQEELADPGLEFHKAGAKR